VLNELLEFRAIEETHDSADAGVHDVDKKRRGFNKVLKQARLLGGWRLLLLRLVAERPATSDMLRRGAKRKVFIFYLKINK